MDTNVSIGGSFHCWGHWPADPPGRGLGRLRQQGTQIFCFLIGPPGGVDCKTMIPQLNAPNKKRCSQRYSAETHQLGMGVPNVFLLQAGCKTHLSVQAISLWSLHRIGAATKAK